MAEAAKPSKARPSKARKKRTHTTRTDDIRLTGDRIVVENPDNGERTSRSGLLIPATAAPAPKRCVWGDVLLVGPDVRTAKTGDTIILGTDVYTVRTIDKESVTLQDKRTQKTFTKKIVSTT